MAARKPPASKPPPTPSPALPYVGRFAPTPSGPLHMGSLATALASYADAKHAGGKWILRIEDIDENRVTLGSRDTILRTLTRFGFVWDGEVIEQTKRKALYRRALEALSATDRVFVCKCSKASLVGEPRNISGELFYPGRCRDRQFVDFGFVSKRYITDDLIIDWQDMHFGPQTQDLELDIGDFVLRRTDGVFAYHLAVVVDDADHGVTRVVRGADLMSSTARQIALQKALGFHTPEYLHLPVLVNGRGEKLGKSTLAAALAPDNMTKTLHAVWALLGQREPPASALAGITEFHAFAQEHWDTRLLPKTSTIPYRAP